MRLHDLELVTPEVMTTRGALEEQRGVGFSTLEAGLGNACAPALEGAG